MNHLDAAPAAPFGSVTLAGARTLTNSRMTARRTCQQLEYLRYQRGYRPVRRARALGFGSLVHDGLEAWSKAERGEAQLDAALAALETAVVRSHRENDPIDPYDAARARVMLTGYHERWVDDDLEWLAVELPFKMELRNPATGRTSRLWEVEGKFDGITRRIATQWMFVVERKTAGVDISAGSTYWQKLDLDSQVSIYLDGAHAAGYDVRGVIYDVLGKPQLKPYKETPEADRRYTEKASKSKDGTVRPAGSLHANQRERDETVEEFEARVIEEVAKQPDKYFRRGEIVRLDAEIEAARTDIWQLANQMRESERRGWHPRSPNACERFNRMCEFFPVCSGRASLDDPMLYRKLTNVHPELESVEEGA